jgi:uncharacterized radical SAM superfamily protein
MSGLKTKLEYTKAAKEAIRGVLIAKGIDVPGGIPFMTYADLIETIQGGASGPYALHRNVMEDSCLIEQVTLIESTANADGSADTTGIKVSASFATMFKYSAPPQYMIHDDAAASVIPAALPEEE